ncbi:hypothetical protein BHE74_00033568 [Ensete ventricosum]|nr:hypothetical protein GW17_00029898 [Ensete ventricosum]RWW59485.1 hypothetical protein BHE74_00033568 [Ensete ventricosum]
MYVHKPKDTDKHEHFIKHIVYILTVTPSVPARKDEAAPRPHPRTGRRGATLPSCAGRRGAASSLPRGEVHGNVCLASVVVTPTLDWKLHAFDVLSEFDGNNEASNSAMLVFSVPLVTILFN